MGDIVKEMQYQFAETFTGNHILLAADMAIPAQDPGATIETILFLSFWCVGQTLKIFLKIGKYGSLS